MSDISEKLILVDADGVLLDWKYSFDMWMKRHEFELIDPDEYDISKRYNVHDVPDGYRMAKIFNESSWIRKLPPYKDAIKYVKKLHRDYGYIFHVISSLSDNEYSQHLRTKNLRELFGDTAFERFTYLDTGADKDKLLDFYKDSNCWWIEDNAYNAYYGKRIGLRSILIEQTYNKNYHHQTAENWKDVYDYIVGNKVYI